MKLTTRLAHALQRLIVPAIALAVFLGLPEAASATVAPWDTSVTAVLGWFTGSTALNIGILAMAVSLFGMMLSNSERGMGMFKVVGSVAVLMVIVNMAAGMFTPTGALVA